VLTGEGPQLARLQLAPQGQPGTPDAFAKNWHDKLWRLPLQDLLGKGEAPAGGSPQPELKVTYRRGRRELGKVELGRVGRDIYLRSEHTAGWAKPSPGPAEELLLEAEKVATGS
jgi:hypothetical protein